MKKRQKIKKEILGKKRVIPSVSFLFKKLKTFFLPEIEESNELTASDRSAFLLPVFNTWGKAPQKQPYRRCSKVSFLVLRQIYAKMWKAIFTKFSLILKTKRLFHNQSLMLDADQLFHNLIDGVLSAASRY
ncbi:hypothetical protein N8D09_09035 [Enterococcus faecium]